MTANIDITTLRALNGTALKLYILLSNFPEGLTAKQLADLLGVRESTIYYALSEFQKNGIDSKKLENKFQIIGKFQKNGIEKETKEKALFPHTPNLEKENKEKEDYLSTASSSRVREGGGEEEGRRKIEDIILDNTEHLSALLQQCGLPPKPNLIDFFRPYAQAFCIHLQAGGDDLYLLESDRRGVKNRFRYWFLKNYNNYDITRHFSGALDARTTVQEPQVDWDAIGAAIEQIERDKAERAKLYAL